MEVPSSLPRITLAEVGREIARLFVKVKKITSFPSFEIEATWPRTAFRAEADRFDLWAVNFGSVRIGAWITGLSAQRIGTTADHCTTLPRRSKRYTFRGYGLSQISLDKFDTCYSPRILLRGTTGTIQAGWRFALFFPRSH